MKIKFLKSIGPINQVLLLMAFITVAASAGVAFLSPGNGASCYPTGCPAGAVRGSFVDPTAIKFKIKTGNEEVINADGGQVVMHEITLAPASSTANGLPGSTGWHSHPGPVVVTIKSGTMTFYEDDCTVRTFMAGDSFVDKGQGHIHIARNEGTEPLVLWATYFGVPAGATYRNDVPAPAACQVF